MEKDLNEKYKLQCVNCHKSYDANPLALTCTECGDYKGTLDVIYPYDRIAEGIRRDGLAGETATEIFFDILPTESTFLFPSLAVGETPLYNISALFESEEVQQIYLKDDTVNPSGSYKDRASFFAIAMARQAGMDTIAVASTGNAAASSAALAASAGMKAILFVPETAPAAKLTQLYIHGAEVLKFSAGYDEIFDLCNECCHQFGWFNRNTGINPYTGEGKKTAALEIFLDLGFAPHNLIVSVGDGCIYGANYKGFYDLRQLGLIDKIPGMFGIQAEGCAPLARAFHDNAPVAKWSDNTTSADSIAVAYPRDGMKALRAARETGGEIIAVDDNRIFSAQYELARRIGIFAEPSAAASYAGFKKLLAEERIRKDEATVIIITGSGLKDIAFVENHLQIHEEPLRADIEAVAKKLKI